MEADDASWQIADLLLACAQAAGFTLTLRQIERWRKADLLPRPRHIALGRARGTRSESPPGSCAQLIELCRLRSQGETRLHYLGFTLWRLGYPVPAHAVKRSIERLAFQPYRGLRRRDQAPDETAMQAAIAWMPDLPRSKLGRAIRRQLPNDAEVQRVLTAILQLAMVGGPVFASPPKPGTAGTGPLAELFIRAMALDVARTEGISEAGPWLTGDPGEDLAGFEQQGLFSPEHLREMLRLVPMEAVERARTNAEILAPGFAGLARLLQTTGAPEIFGWVFRLVDPA